MSRMWHQDKVQFAIFVIFMIIVLWKVRELLNFDVNGYMTNAKWGESMSLSKPITRESFSRHADEM
jgi:hypothetical protein